MSRNFTSDLSCYFKFFGLMLLFFAGVQSRLLSSNEEPACETGLLPNLPKGPDCKNFFSARGDWRYAPVILIGEHHNYQLQTMACLLSLMNARNDTELKKFVYFEGDQITSKKEYLGSIRKFDFLTTIGKFFRNACEKSTDCRSWDDLEAHKKIMSANNALIFGGILSEIGEIIKQGFASKKDPQKATIPELLKYLDKKEIDSGFMSESVDSLKKQILRRINSELEKNPEKQLIEIFTQDILPLKKELSPDCAEIQSIQDFFKCTDEKLIETLAKEDKNRNAGFSRKIRKAVADGSGKVVSFFRAGDSHVRAAEERLKKGLLDQVAVIRHLSLKK